MGAFRKSIIAAICAAAMFIFLPACGRDNPVQGSSKSTDHSGTNALSLDKSEIKKINISVSLPLFDAFDVTDEEQISNIADYLVSLRHIETKLNPDDYLGNAYSIKVLLKDNTERIFVLMGNKFFMEKDVFTCEIPYEEATRFEPIISDILQDRQSQNGEASVTGTVVSVKSADSGHNVSCIIKDKDGTNYDLYVKDAKIIDTTGNGWMILHEKDVVRVFFSKGPGEGDKTVAATMVFILQLTDSPIRVRS
jgi:hypothetical protein